MMTDITKVVFAVIFSVIISSLLKKFGNDFSTAVSVITGISVTVFSIAILSPVFDYINELNKDVQYKGFASIVFKSAGVCLLCSTACEICKEMKEDLLASKIELAGKCTLIAFSLPLIKAVFDYAKTFID